MPVMEPEKTIKKSLLLYLDNCAFNRPFDDQKQIRIRLETEAKLYIQDKIISKEFLLVWSYMLDYENDLNPFEERRNIILLWKSLSTIDIEESTILLKTAAKLLKRNLHPKDAIHLSSAIVAKSDYYITTDDMIIKKMADFDKLIVASPIKFLELIDT